jgi:L-fuculokinase
MLANVDAKGRAVPCARFMGGREFAALNRLRADACTDADVAAIVEQRIFALPSFADTGGPFPGQRGRIVGAAPKGAAACYALASLYCALVTDHCLTALGATGDIVIEGSFTANLHYAAVLAALRPQQRAWLSDNAAGSVRGGFVLANGEAATATACNAVAPFRSADIGVYRDEWAAHCMP